MFTNFLLNRDEFGHNIKLNLTDKSKSLNSIYGGLLTILFKLLLLAYIIIKCL